MVTGLKDDSYIFSEGYDFTYSLKYSNDCWLHRFIYLWLGNWKECAKWLKPPCPGLDYIVFHMLPFLLRDPIALYGTYFQVKSLHPVSVMDCSSKLFLYRSNFTIRYDGINADKSMQLLKVSFYLIFSSREVSSVGLHALQKSS